MVEEGYVTLEECKKHRECMARELATKTQSQIQVNHEELVDIIAKHDAQAKEILDTQREAANDLENTKTDTRCMVEVSRNLITSMGVLATNYENLHEDMNKSFELQNRTIEIQAKNTEALSTLSQKTVTSEANMKWMQDLVMKMIVYGGTAFMGMLGAILGLKFLGISL